MNGDSRLASSVLNHLNDHTVEFREAKRQSKKICRIPFIENLHVNIDSGIEQYSEKSLMYFRASVIFVPAYVERREYMYGQRTNDVVKLH